MSLQYMQNLVPPMTESVSTTSGCIIKICRVCGDRAIGFNFNGLTCESCKSFFRRNAPKYEKYTCRKDGNCLIDFVTRKCCTTCRLNKCFSIGMKRELICSKMDRETSSSSSTHSEHDTESTCGSTPFSPHYKNGSSIERILTNEIHSQLAKCSMFFSGEEEPLDDSEPTLRQNYFIELNTHEFGLIQEIEQATEVAQFYDETKFQLVGEVHDLIYALNLAEAYIKKTIKFCKAIPAFRILSQDDQLTILKDFFTEMLIIRFCYAFNPEKDGIPVIEDEEKKVAILIRLNLLYDAKKQNFLYYARHNLFRANTEFEHDPILRDLIIVQRLFKPRDNISRPEFIRYQYSIYNHLLNRYLEHKYQNAQKAATKVHIITDILKEMNAGRGILEGIFGDCDPSQLGMVIAEIYNLK